jgi:hypothetical protein
MIARRIGDIGFLFSDFRTPDKAIVARSTRRFHHGRFGRHRVAIGNSLKVGAKPPPGAHNLLDTSPEGTGNDKRLAAGHFR